MLVLEMNRRIIVTAPVVWVVCISEFMPLIKVLRLMSGMAGSGSITVLKKVSKSLKMLTTFE